jgi:acetoin utilization protein AcuC
MKQPVYLIHSDEYKNWIFDPTHPTQGRRFNNARDLLITSTKKEGIDVVEILPRLATEAELLRVHTPAYIDEVLNQYISTEWDGQRADLANLASLFVGGTLTALDTLLTNKTKLAIHFPGAKHHAQSDHSSGFCVFNDFALAADIASKDHGKNIIIIDIDAHHGDGVENLTAANPKVLTFSVHQCGIFPGTGYESEEGNFYNTPLEDGAGDDQLLDAIEQFISAVGARDRIWDWQPDLLFITCGADGHIEDPLTGLNYSVEGYIAVAKRLQERFPELPILLGGAGGYLPDTITPEIWAKVAAELAQIPPLSNVSE